MTFKLNGAVTCQAFLFATLFALPAYAQESGGSTSLSPNLLYVTLQGGASFSMESEIDLTINPPDNWDVTPEGYNDTLGNSEILGIGLGYVINRALALELDLAHRGSFNYERYQTSPPVDEQTNKTRYFDLENTSLMANLLIDGAGLSDHLSYEFNKISVSPFVNLGVGVSFNTVSDFHSVRVPEPNKSEVFSILQDNTRASFSYQVGAGLAFNMTDKISLLVGYQYFNAGEYRTNDYLSIPGVLVSPWEGTLESNEVYLALRLGLEVLGG